MTPASRHILRRNQGVIPIFNGVTIGSDFTAITAFQRVARWLPAMTRAIRTIRLHGPTQLSWSAAFQPTRTNGIEVVFLIGTEPGRALALDLGEETTLFLPLGVDGPIAAAADVPRLWLLAPLAESLNTGWLMNGRQFRVDPGRGRLAGTEEERQTVFRRLGEALGVRLLALHELAQRDWSDFSRTLCLANDIPESGFPIFWHRLADLFAEDFVDKMAQELHGPGRGYGRLVAERPVLPTGLPRPFQPFLTVNAGEKMHRLAGVKMHQ